MRFHRFPRFRVALAAVGLTIGTSTGAGAEIVFKQYTIGTSSTGGASFAVATGIAKAMKDQIDRPMRVQPFGGLSAVMALVNKGEIAFGLGDATGTGRAFRGEAPYRPAPNLRLIGALYGLPASIVVRAASGINSIADLKGKRVAGEFRGMQAIHNLTEGVLANGGLGWNDVRLVPFTSPRPAVEALVQGRIDAVHAGIGPPAMREVHNQIKGGIRYLALDTAPEALKRMEAAAPGTYTRKMPGGRFPGLPDAIPVQFVNVFLYTTSDLPAADATAVTRKIIDRQKEIAASGHPLIRRFNQRFLVSAAQTIPYHEGSIAAYRALGLWSDRHDAQQKRVVGR